MTRPWRRVRLGEVLEQVSRPVAPTAGVTYRQLGVRLWGQGAYERDSIDGAATQYRQLFQLAADDIVVNKIWARNGAVAVVDSDLAGTFVSSEFPSFLTDSDALSARWFYWLTRTPEFWSKCEQASRGTTSKSRIRPDQFLKIEIFLPDRAEQDRIVARLDAVAAKVDEARRLRAELAADARRVLVAMLRDEHHAVRVKLRDVLKLRPPDVQVMPDHDYEFAGVYSFGRGAFRGARRAGSSISYKYLTRLRTGNLVYPKLMAWEGALAIVPPECDGLVVSTEFPVFEVDTSVVTVEVLDVFAREQLLLGAVNRGSTGTNVRRRRLKPADLLAIEIEIPGRQRQLEIQRASSQVRVMESSLSDDANLATQLEFEALRHYFTPSSL